MKKVIVILIVFVLLISLVNANIISTIGMTGLSFVNPTAATIVSNVLCVTSPVGVVTCATQFVQGKIVGQVYGEALKQIAEVSPEVAKSITTYNQVKGYVDNGAEILKELEVDEEGDIISGKIYIKENEPIGNLLGFGEERNEDAYAKGVNVEEGFDGYDYNYPIPPPGTKVITFEGENSQLYIKQQGVWTFFENIKSENPYSDRKSVV